MSIRNLLTPAARASGSLAGAVAAALAMGSSLPAHAQQAGASSGIEEIVVTAQRREENLQDVGIAVTALSGQMLTDMNITMATDITRAVPSLKMNAYSSSQVVFNIRGVSQNDYGDQQEPPVAVYQDDSYASSINVASFPIFDLARVEVLRGPQGTLFGRNATGGAIQFVSNKPTEDFEGYATATVGSYGQFIVEGALSGPLADNFQARIAAISNTDDGYMESIVAGVPDRGGNDHYAVRGQLAWQPSETTDLNLIVRYMKANKETQAGIYSQEPACPNDQFQGEFTQRRSVVRLLGHRAGRGRHGVSQRRDHAEPRRRPVEDRGNAAFLRRPRDHGRHAALRLGHRRRCTWSRSPTTRTPPSSTSKAATRRPWTACCSTRAATSSSIRRNSACRARWAPTRGWPACTA